MFTWLYQRDLHTGQYHIHNHYINKFDIRKNNDLKSLSEKSLDLKLKPTFRVCEKHFDRNYVLKIRDSVVNREKPTSFKQL